MRANSNELNDRATILWRRLDLPGHEAAELERFDDGWRLSGVATFVESTRPCRLDYKISCDAEWRTQQCVLQGFVGAVQIRLNISRSPSGDWTRDGAPITGVAGAEDIDLGFSPATNLLPIRRLKLNVGDAAQIRAAWVRFPELTIEVLEQVYTRVAPDRYVYESAGGKFRRELLVDAVGFVLDYPGLWLAEAHSSAAAV